jgi:L-aminopeptidase/D-esterase-like protein
LGDGESIISESAGQAAAFGKFRVGDLESGVLVCTVVNSMGGLMDRNGSVVRGHLKVDTDVRMRAAEIITPLDSGTPSAPRPVNTTLSVVVTDCGMPDFYVRQAARQIHSSVARAIDPFQTEYDGDVLYLVRPIVGALTTPAQLSEATIKLGILGSELMWDAILQCWS